MDNLTDDQCKMQRRSVSLLRLEADTVLDALRSHAAAVRDDRDSAVTSAHRRMLAAGVLRTIEEIEEKIGRAFARN